MSASSRFAHILRALRHRDFAIFTAGNLMNRTGFWVYRIAVGWLTWELTESATWLGLMGLAELLPTLFFGPIAGVLADRINRLQVVRLTQVLMALLAGTNFVLAWSGHITVEALFALMLAQGFVQSLNQPARQALVPALIGYEDIHAGIAITSFVANSARFIGPAVAGIVITRWGVAPAFAISTVAFCVLEGALWMIRLEDKESAPKARKRLLSDAWEGIRYAARHPGIGPLLLVLSITAVLGRPIVPLLPGFAAEVFGRGADGLAWFTSMMGAGAVIGGAYMVQRSGIQGLTRVFISQAALTGIALVAFTAHDLFLLALPIMVVIGWAQMVNGVAAQTLVQHAVDDAVRGRVASVYGMIVRGGQALGAVVMGAAADVFGLRPTVAVAGALCLLCSLWALRRSRTMRDVLEADRADGVRTKIRRAAALD